MGQRLPLACSSNRSRPAGTQTVQPSNKGCEPSHLQYDLMPLRGGFSSRSFPQPSQPLSCPSRTLPGLQQGGPKLTMILGSQITSASSCSWGAIVFISTNTLQYGMCRRERASPTQKTQKDTTATGALTTLSWKSTGKGSRPGPCFTEASRGLEQNLTQNHTAGQLGHD